VKKPSLIPAGMLLEGELEGDTDLIVHGHVHGPIRVGGALVIEASGVVRGHVHAHTVTVRGVLKGNAFGDEAVRVDEGAKLVGDLRAPRVHVVPGARFRGQIHMASLGEPPRLAAYDPSHHTFTGAPVPTWTGQPAPSLAAPPVPLISAPPPPPLEGPATLPPAALDTTPGHAEAPPTLPGVAPDEPPPRRRRVAPRKLPALGKVQGRRRSGG